MTKLLDAICLLAGVYFIDMGVDGVIAAFERTIGELRGALYAALAACGVSLVVTYFAR